MKKVLVGMLIGLGLVIGSGFVNEVNACDESVECNFAEEVIEEHIHEDKCTETHYSCGECGGYYCENLTCWCGEEVFSDYIFEQDHDHRHALCEECGEIYGIDECYIGCDCVKRIETEEHADCICGSFQLQCENCGGLYCQEYACECGRCEGIIDEANEVSVVMNYEEYYELHDIVFEMYLEECVNHCEECDYYYYKHCMCEACEEREACEACYYYDFDMYIEDNYEMIVEIAEDIVAGNYAYTNEMSEEVVLVIYEF